MHCSMYLLKKPFFHKNKKTISLPGQFQFGRRVHQWRCGQRGDPWTHEARHGHARIAHQKDSGHLPAHPLVRVGGGPRAGDGPPQVAKSISGSVVRFSRVSGLGFFPPPGTRNGILLRVASTGWI